jgi:adenylate cyclase
MTDVFISYARPDEGQAERVADSLRQLGYRVWRDDELPAHRAYADVIEERLKSANAVVVLWSAEAARSQWVRSEADAARQLQTLVQATIDATLPPMPFDQFQCADLSEWEGNASSAGWRKLASSVATLAGSPGSDSSKSPRQRASQVSVCVLPFANMSGDAEQEYFSDGISEDITTDLSKVSALEVIARNSAFQFKGQSVDVCDVAQRLGVSHVLEGSVRKAGSRVRMTAQLIDGRTGGHVWADRYDRDLTDIFAIQDEISAAIVAALKINLHQGEKEAIEQRGTNSPEAYDLYLMARDYWINGNYGDARREQVILRLCQGAVDIDPSYARAWALMALTQADMRYRGTELREDGMAAAEKALQYNPAMAEPHCVKARFFALQGRHDEANAEIAVALKLNPDSWEVNREAASVTFRQGRIREAARYFERAAELVETDCRSAGMMLSCYHGLNE